MSVDNLGMITWMLIMPAMYIVTSFYIYRRLKTYLKALTDNKKFFIGYNIVWVAVWILILIDTIRGHMFGAVNSWYMGVWLYFLMPLLLFEIINLVFKKLNKKYSAIAILVLAIVPIVYGGVNAYIIDVNEFDVEISKPIDDLKMVVISDTHYGGTQGVSKARQMVNKINEQSPDIVCLTGDIFDGNFDWVKKPDEIAEILSEINAHYGVYACWGNHDQMGENNESMRDFLEKSEITLLEDKVTLVNNEFYIIGRNDARTNRDPSVKPIEELMDEVEDKSKAVIVMDHRPKELQLYADIGVDLLLSGHTHNGQTFPNTLFIDGTWDNAYGIKTIGDFTSFTTSGVGLWGAPYRVGSDAEVAVLDINGI